MSNDLTSTTKSKESKVVISPSDKVIIYTITAKAEELTFRVIVDYEKIRDIVCELHERCQYTIIGSSERRGTYLEYLLSALVKAISDENFSSFKSMTYSKDSNNMINTIINYEKRGELDTDEERKTRKGPVINLSGYKREFELEILRDLYNRAKKCIGFKLITRTESEIGDSVDFEEVQSYVKK